MPDFPEDLVKRFTGTPFEVTFPLLGTTIRLMTNSRVVTDRFAACGQVKSDLPTEFQCRLVAEDIDDPALADGRPSVTRVRNNGLSLINIGQKSFLALDFDGRTAVSFVSERLITNETLFRSYFLPALTLLFQGSESTLNSAENDA
jgi:hypothetical protein